MAEAIRYSIEPRKIQFDGFQVARLLPRIGIKGVGPWLFFDHMGPHQFEAGQGLDVPPHPHINLATVTYLFEGEILHKDSIGNVQSITPGAINLMVAGAGIAHSERGPDALRQSRHSVHGLQLWHALPEEHEEIAASFHHYPVDDLPRTTLNGVKIRLLIGEAFGLTSPVRTFSQTLYAEYHLRAGQSAAVPEDVEELAVYAIDSELNVDNEILAPRRLALLTEGTHHIYAESSTRAVFIGGQSLGKRYMWWNFVSSRKDRIGKAIDDWKQGHFGAVYDDDGTPAPLPDSDSYALMSD
ncbi:MAG: pirin family protein [Desulfosarcinaceae bacterium]|nr:pirin family protein [Desulfosarcinaceae bacterium]